MVRTIPGMVGTLLTNTKLERSTDTGPWLEATTGLMGLEKLSSKEKKHWKLIHTVPANASY